MDRARKYEEARHEVLRWRLIAWTWEGGREEGRKKKRDTQIEEGAMLVSTSTVPE